MIQFVAEADLSFFRRVAWPEKKQSSGFTLVELMIAFSLALLTIILASYAFSQATNTAEYTSKKQIMQDLSNKLLRLIRKDVRSSTEAFISPDGIRLKIFQLTQAGMPESQEVLYLFKETGVERIEENQRKEFPFPLFLRKDDYWSIDVFQSAPAGSGFYLEIFAVDAYGKELIRLKERLIKIDITNP
ncbi:MAG: prepilin-type N-terminal cleavage/methylation domain-containing protein [Candidatus Riflebacteria bacterium]|nr:prepilin-type N-terminal cleavage/methylation domain-containing protein [Candidatus Riflebacteria bacterium]